ncbi:hypothetical protein [Georgenia sp. SUBG003]|uniref:hypothetical protein n=1 Tax=Georgenia sp. SUBG003 TaxID=1497974 RepID=UPI003AB16FE6
MSVRQTFDQVRDGAVVLAEYAVETVYAAGHPEWRRSGATAEEESRELPAPAPHPAGTALRRAAAGGATFSSWFSPVSW